MRRNQLGTTLRVIRLESVHVQFSQGPPALDALSLEIRAGELIALVGPSGSGKTTALRTMNALCRPHSGSVLFRGRSLPHWNEVELRRRIGYVIQEVGLFPHWTVERNIGCVPTLLGWSQADIDDRVSELLRDVDLSPETATRYPSQLSGGQRQRVGIARALAARPECLLMDEPFGALDPITRLRLRDLLEHLRQQHQLTIVMVTHDLQDAIALADRIAILRDGRLVELSTTAELLEAPADPWAKEFLAAARLPLSKNR